jgi:hypothetical protein
MRYVVVNGRAPFHGFCALCGDPLIEGYVREFETNLLYCSIKHFRGACEVAMAAIEHHAREVS